MAKLKAIYTINELARAAGVSRYTMHRLIMSNKVEVNRSGRSIYIFLPNLKRALPGLVEALAGQPDRPRFP